MSSINQFGFLKAPKDGNDFSYLMRTARPQIVAAVGKPKPRKTDYKDGPLLDQGQTPHCTGYTGRGFLDGAPIMSKPSEGPSAVQLYHDAQDRDEWPGTNYDGSSIRGLMKALQDAGQISSYVWGQTVEEAIKWMNDGFGTLCAGTNWYAEMSEVDRNGFMREPPPSGTTPIGGHAYRWKWFDPVKKGILMRNSWGHDFGFPDKKGVLTGYAYMRVELAIRLLREDGELAAPTQIKIKAIPMVG